MPHPLPTSSAFDDIANAFQPVPAPGPGRTPGKAGTAVLPVLWTGPGFLPYVLLHVSGARRGRRAAVVLGRLLTLVSLAGVVVGMVAACS